MSDRDRSHLKMKIIIIIDGKPMIYDMTALFCQAISKRIRPAVFKINQIIKFPMRHLFHMNTVRILLKTADYILDRYAVTRYYIYKII
jgi:hypothetical protein